MTEDLCVCGPMTRAQSYCECGAEESAAELRYGGNTPERLASQTAWLERLAASRQFCGDPGDCNEAVGRATLERPYFDLEGNEGTLAEVYS